MFRLRKANQDVVTIAANGNVRFVNFFKERSPRPVQSGEIRFHRRGVAKAASLRTGATRDFNLQRRLFEHALFPDSGLQIKHATEGVAAEFDPSGNLHIRGRVTNILANPSVPGPFTVDSAIYAAPGLNYGGSSSLAEYLVFETPTPSYATRVIDISDFADLPTSPPWPFSSTDVPINGLLRIPRGAGPFPLMLISHGNHSPMENSTPGYVYLLDLLASHGVIAGSIDCNFLNGANNGENDGRAIVHLEHVRQFRIWNGQAGHPLRGKVDMTNIMIAGHSRGGEGVGHASAFNSLSSVVPDPGDPPVPLDGTQGLGPYRFNLQAAIAIAPTENQYEPVGGPVEVRDNYVVMHGSRDGDVFDFQGHLTYDRAQTIDLGNPTTDARGFKALLWIYGANHNHFNSVWSVDGTPTISRQQQENVAEVYFSALAQSLLLQRGQFFNLIRNSQLAHQQNWIPNSITLVSQYQDNQRTFVAHYEEDNVPTTPSPPVAGAITASGLTTSEFLFDQGSFGNLFQQTDGLEVEWLTAGGRYSISIDPGGLSVDGRHILGLRVGQSDDTKNLVNRFQDFTVIVSDGTQSHSVRAAAWAPLPYPDLLAVGGGTRRSVMQSLRVPLRRFLVAGVDVENIRQIVLLFDRPISGTTQVQGSVYVDEIQVSR